MHDVTLTGIDGTNPLGFLATLGALAATTDVTADTRLRWQHYEGAWRPVLSSEFADVDTLIQQLDQDRQTCIGDPALGLEYDGKKDLKPPPGRFRQLLEALSAEASPTNRRSVDWIGAFGTDVALDNNGNTKPTALHFTAGQQQFLQMVDVLIHRTTKEDLREALAGPWRYQRPLPVMGWDGSTSRDYALRATDPSTDKKLGVPGADWLAIRGLTFLPTVPRGNRVLTTGCVGGWKDGQLRWPLWTVSLTASVIRSLLRAEIEQMTMMERRARGIGAVFTAGIKRSDQGGYGSFEPSAAI
jgi:hypothetical protein